MNLTAPSSRPLPYVTPSSAELLLRCPLRLSFANMASVTGVGSPAAWIGDAAHFSLERLVKQRGMWSENPGQEATRLFDEEIARRVDRVDGDLRVRWGAEPERWPGFALKRARLVKVAQRLSRLLQDISPDKVLAEVDYSTFDGRMRGRADLVVNAPELHAVADYKTGQVLDEDHETLPAYERQVRLYCVMEEERAGSFPALGWLIPFDGPTVEVQIDAAVCGILAVETLHALSGYNDRAPGPQPGKVSTASCPTCPYAPVCPSFWRSPREGLPEGTEAVQGLVREVRRVQFGGTSLLIQPSASTLMIDSILVRNILHKDHSAIAGVAEGEFVSMVGLVPEPERGTYRLGRRGRMRVLQAKE